MHDRSIVIRLDTDWNRRRGVPRIIIAETWLQVVHFHVEIRVAVLALLLMAKADGMTKFVDDVTGAATCGYILHVVPRF